MVLEGLDEPGQAGRVAEVQELLDLGVEIQNHGWTHTRVGALDPVGHLADIRRGRDWLSATFGVPGDIYAVPNGDGMPVPGYFEACRAWLLLDAKTPGRTSRGVVNRKTLHLYPRASRIRKRLGWLQGAISPAGRAHRMRR